ncbi:dehydrogenase with different specificitie [Eremomyces bilateralis CBS 781.70]|uniref:Dehydrogenase with different specificitie n=1 Tax=Eremomyces bilateralis CBS 781.70 TaxID=1392243 RepID=A0A6G1G7K2_9PEZI|nr:dehydrogenase with different specificitie [Eremomyces bilateralis CBS 781.70]KAF1814038.1 dehydrogenase with different specificitie [Eremomyces bilateralis CBS 781.70]
MSKLLEGKVAIITGSGGGLGATIATTFLTHGASVVLSDISTTRLSDKLASLSALGPVHAVTTDITSEASVAALFSAAKEKFGRVDILVNNAGVMDKFDPVAELEKELWDRVIGANLTGTFLCSRAAVREMLGDVDAEEAVVEETRGEGMPAPAPPTRGVILNIGSVAGVRGGSGGAAYTASKHGVIGLTKNTAAAYARRGIRCNAILPGGMATNISDSLAKGINTEGFGLVQKTMAVGAPLCELGDVAELCAWLCGGSRVVNGAVVAADGGWTAA